MPDELNNFSTLLLRIKDPAFLRMNVTLCLSASLVVLLPADDRLPMAPGWASH
jgi:hypothetical protein